MLFQGKDAFMQKQKVSIINFASRICITVLHHSLSITDLHHSFCLVVFASNLLLGLHHSLHHRLHHSLHHRGISAKLLKHKDLHNFMML